MLATLQPSLGLYFPYPFTCLEEAVHKDKLSHFYGKEALFFQFGVKMWGDNRKESKQPVIKTAPGSGMVQSRKSTSRT